MLSNILVAYGSKYGATAEISEKIGDVLRQAGFNVDVLPADRVEAVNRYQAVILGSAVYAGQWRKEATLVLKAFEDELAHMPVWLFSSGPTGAGDPVELLKGWKYPEAQEPLVHQIQPRDTAVFHGDLNTEKLNIGEKLIVRGVKAPLGDFRDWDAITGWADGIAEALKQENELPA